MKKTSFQFNQKVTFLLNQRNVSGKIVDTVVMNPPFGTRKKGADMEFLSAAMKVKGEKQNLFSLFSEFQITYIFNVLLPRWPLKLFIPCIRHLLEK